MLTKRRSQPWVGNLVLTVSLSDLQIFSGLEWREVVA